MSENHAFDSTNQVFLVEEPPIVEATSIDRKKEAPSGWKVVPVLRKSGKHKGLYYKYYVEPGTEVRFRSLKNAWARYDQVVAMEQLGNEGASSSVLDDTQGQVIDSAMDMMNADEEDRVLLQEEPSCSHSMEMDAQSPVMALPVFDIPCPPQTPEEAQAQYYSPNGTYDYCFENPICDLSFI